MAAGADAALERVRTAHIPPRWFATPFSVTHCVPLLSAALTSSWHLASLPQQPTDLKCQLGAGRQPAMAAGPPFRLSSFFFGRSGSLEAPRPLHPQEQADEPSANAAHDPAGSTQRQVANGGSMPASDGEGTAELRQRLLEGEDLDVDVEAGRPQDFRFSWRRLILHVG
jgi:hypothetical protein